MALSADEGVRLENLVLNKGVNSLQDAILEGTSKLGMVDGFKDVFTDETGVNTGGSTQQYYDSTNDYYQNIHSGDPDLLIQSDAADGSSSFSDSSRSGMTVESAGAVSPTHEDTVTDAFGGSTTSLYFANTANQRLQAGAVGESAFDFGSGSWTVKFRMRADSVSTTQSLISLYGASGDKAWGIEISGINDTLRLNYSTDGSAGIQIYTNNNAVSAATWHWVVVTHDGSKTRFYIDGDYAGGGARTDTINYNNTSEKLTIGSRPNVSLNYTGYLDEIYIKKGVAEVTTEIGTGDITDPGASSDNNMVLLGAAQTALSDPTNCRIVALHSPIDSLTLNTDSILAVSRDGGTSFTNFTLTKRADYGTIDGESVEVLVTDDLDISGQLSGSSVVYRLTTANGKKQRLNGVYVQWR